MAAGNQGQTAMPLSTEPPTSPYLKRWQLSQHLWISVVVPLFLFVMLISAVEMTVRQEQWRSQNAATQQLISNTNEVRTLFEYELNSTLHLTTGLVSYIQSKHGALVAQELDPWLTNLQERGKHIRNIGIAPNNKITYIYPLAGNEAALGLYYPDNKDQWPDVKKTILGRKPVLAGPLTLRQGGRGLVYRVPVYMDDGDYWGLISTVLNFDELYTVINTRAQQLDIKIAVIDLDSGSSKQKVLFGDSSIIHNYKYTSLLDVPGRHWQIISSTMAASTNTTAKYFSPHNLRIGGWIISMLLAVLLYSFLRSLAQRNAAALALDESRYRFSQAFSTSPQSMAIINNQGAWLDFNNSLCAALGYTHEQLFERNFFSLLTQEQQLHIRNIIALNTSQSFTSQYDATILHRDGHFINTILSLAPLQADSLNNSNWIVQFIDISHRVITEKLLKEEALYNQAILNSVVDGIMTIDTQGVIRSINPATETIFDCDSTQLLNQHIGYFLQEPHAGNILHHIKNHRDNDDINNNIHHEIVGLKLYGAVFPLEIYFSCIYRHNEKIFIAVVRDISERKRLDQMKNDFISIVSHELRTPLTAILGSLRLLDSGALGDFAEQTKKMIHIAYKNGNKLSFLINDLLDMDKLLAGKMQFDFKIQLVVPLVNQTIESNNAYAAQYSVEFELHNSTINAKVNVDGYRLQQVISNLLSNAAKFSPPNTRVLINILKKDSYIRIEIIDKGAGIPAAAQQHLFEKFYQVDSSSTRQKNGTGLGLAISRELMESMNGIIGVVSAEGYGSCFFIELPLMT